ncbi:MAG: pyridoxamine 5'-phosphate oxidase family protein [Nitrosopumilaceae archaeon]|jgi:predicted pyridoxine 5'-phosphate oxidase superfamily flavin-nucleotide-binding protein
MVKIPDKIKEFIEDQGVFVVGTTSDGNMVNVSPRIFFKIDDEVVYWLDFFKHKSYKNFKANPWTTIAVFNKESLKGYQFRGTVSFVTDEPTKSQIKNSIVSETLERISSPKIKSLSDQDAEVIQFEVKVCYSLNPEEYTDMSIGSDVDSTQVY